MILTVCYNLLHLMVSQVFVNISKSYVLVAKSCWAFNSLLFCGSTDMKQFNETASAISPKDKN